MSAPTLEWKAVPSHIAEGPAEVRHKDGWLVCEVSADSYARLIAAAPELLAVAIKVLPLLEATQRLIAPEATKRGMEPDDTLLNHIRAAIAKAEGRP